MERKQYLSGAYSQEDDSNEQFVRPRYLRDFQGQTAIKENLSVFIKAAM